MARRKKRVKYSYAERKAYYMGVGAGIGQYRKQGAAMKNMPAQVKESFKNGLDRGLTHPTKPVIK